MSGKNHKNPFDVEAPDLETDLIDAPTKNGSESAPPANESAGPLPESPSLSMENVELPKPPTPRSQTRKVYRDSSEDLNRALKKNEGSFPVLFLLLATVGLGGLVYTGMQAYNYVVEQERKRPRLEDMYKTHLEPDSRPQAAPGRTEASAPIPEVKMAVLEIKTDVVGYQVFVGSQAIPVIDNRVEVPPGASTITIRRIGFEDIKLPMSLAQGEVRPVPISFVPEMRRGFLSYETVPSAKLTLYVGEAVAYELQTPIEGFNIPIGTYRAVLENPLIGYRHEEEIVIQEWKTTALRRQLPNNR